MKRIKINLDDPFKKTCDAVLALPDGRYGRSVQRKTVAEALRYLYIAAHGRTLETAIGPITTTAATDPSLTDTSFSLVTRSDLLALARRRTAFAPRAGQNGNSIHRVSASDSSHSLAAD